MNTNGTPRRNRTAAPADPERPPQRRRQQDRNAETRLKLLDSAARTIYEVGYGRASIGEIVRRAGVTKGAHLHHFQTKEQLMRATIEHLFAEVRASQAQVTRSTPLMIDQRTTVELVEKNLDASATDVFDWRFVSLLEIWMASRTEPALHEAFSFFEARYAAVRLQGMRNTFGDEVVDGTDLRYIVGGFNFMLRGLFLQQILGGDWRKNPSWRYWRHETARQMADAVNRFRPAGAAR